LPHHVCCGLELVEEPGDVILKMVAAGLQRLGRVKTPQAASPRRR
jgi:hypothetical protein